MTATKRMTSVNSLALVLAMREPRSYDQLAIATGMSKVAVQRWISKAREDESLESRPYIADYAEDARGRLFVPLWQWGSESDKQRPGAKPGAAAERMRRMRLRKKGEV